jgi:aspartate/methionine/tyrosine aminotransferase
MKIEPFLMERMQSTWENLVDYNLSESGVHPMYLGELLREMPEATEQLLKQELGYAQSNGTVALRKIIAGMYPGATPDHILVTNGTSEANFVSIWSLVEPKDEILLMLPNYMQIWGISRGFQGTVHSFQLREESGWHIDFAEVERFFTRRTKLIVVCNPNNPTGSILKEEEMARLLELARSNDGWLLADEVYQGAERQANRTPSFWGRYDKVIITNGLSKAYGLPGLRIGWVVGPPDFIAKLWSYHDYTTIGPAMMSDSLAQIALNPEIRERILLRTKRILQNNYPIVADWIRSHGDALSIVEPQAGAIAYFRYKYPVNSTQLVERLRKEKSVLIVPGDHFGMDKYLRIGYGSPAEYLNAGLARIDELISEDRRL